MQCISSIRVVNDTAERGIKLTDYNKLLTQDETEKQIILQVISNYKSMYQDISKTSLAKPVE